METSIFGIGQIKEPKVNPVFRPHEISYLFSLIGLCLYFVMFLFFLFGFFIVVFEGLREDYMNWAVASFISMLLTWFISRLVIHKFGARFLRINSDSYSLKFLLGKSKLVKKEDIVSVNIEIPNQFMELVQFSSPKIQLITHDTILEFRTGSFKRSDELLQYFQNLSPMVDDGFGLHFHRSKSAYTSIFIRMSQDFWGMIGLSIVTVYLFIATWGAFAMLISPTDVLHTNTLFLRNPEFFNGNLEGYDWGTAIFHPPSEDFWFGTDFVGRDLFARLVFGTTYTFLIAFLGSIFAIFLIAVLGYSSIIIGGKYDDIIMRISDALLTFPPFIPLILVSTIATPLRHSIQGGYYLTIFIAVSFFTWPTGTRIIRSDVIEILEMDYILATKQIGATKWQIFKSHIFPKTAHTFLLLFTFAFTDVILGMTLLSFIGLDSESTLTWGSDLAKGVSYGEGLDVTWWVVVFPTLWIFVLVFGLTILADAIRDVLDPKLRGGIKAVPFDKRAEMEAIL